MVNHLPPDQVTDEMRDAYITVEMERIDDIFFSQVRDTLPAAVVESLRNRSPAPDVDANILYVLLKLNNDLHEQQQQNNND